MLEWEHVQNKIMANMRIGTDVNTASSNYRKVMSINTQINSRRYGYQDQLGIVISIGRAARVSIPWTMLKECFAQLKESDGYGGKFFRQRFPRQAHDHPCHVHVVGQIFVVAGLAREDSGQYHLINERH